MSVSEPIDDALDALESMVEQYLSPWPPTQRPTEMPQGYAHDFMSAGEEACEVLIRLRPHRWQATGVGLRRRP